MSDAQVDRLIQAVELLAQAVAGALAGVEAAIRESGGRPPPSSKGKRGGRS